ncbi:MULTISPECIES: hypothetical protein [unclassified Streptomyces]|uniref:hypothetical protein n=1 Tax=unclassified Streptomyces TaxID=2593676 RepID=UPI002E2EB9F7|nr:MULTISPECIES: hypothetical protein [unclassified Streptomyces]WUC68473.1 hypothetical protein OG861_31940 [Streptomyces sp. NBC_00539]
MSELPSSWTVKGFRIHELKILSAIHAHQTCELEVSSILVKSIDEKNSAGLYWCP